MSPVEIEIRFDGTAEGLAEHRLSLAAFRDALDGLLLAIRQSADLENAGDLPPTPDDDASTRRRQKSIGRVFDVQIERITGGSLGLVCRIVAMGIAAVGDNDQFYGRLAERTAVRFVRDVRDAHQVNGGRRIQKGSTGVNPGVERFLLALPAGVAHQDIRATSGGREIERASLQWRDPDMFQRVEAPGLRDFRGEVVGTKFERQKERVVIKDATGEEHLCRASRDQIRAAHSLIDVEVDFKLLVTAKFKRLLTMRPVGVPQRVPTADEQHRHVMEVWGETLRRLAQ